MVLPRPLALPPDVLALLMTWAGLGEPHIAIASEPVWLPDDEADDHARTAREQVKAQGLLDRRGRVDVEVAAALAVLCRPTTEFYGWCHKGDRTIGVLAGSIGTEAVLAIGDGETVWLSQSRSKRLPEALVAQTADVPPGRGDPIALRRSETAVEPGPLDAPEPRLKLVERISALPATGGGELHVAVRDSAGRRAQSPRPLRYADTAHGRWLHHAHPLAGGDEKVEVAPASREELARRLREMHRALCGR